MESDFSMCLASLLTYQQPDEIGKIISCAIELKKQIFAVAWHHVGEEDMLGLTEEGKRQGSSI